MRFRITKYYDGFKAERYNEKDDKWYLVGSPCGYHTPERAKDACILYKKEQDEYLIEEFEL